MLAAELEGGDLRYCGEEARNTGTGGGEATGQMKDGYQTAPPTPRPTNTCVCVCVLESTHVYVLGICRSHSVRAEMKLPGTTRKAEIRS